MAAIQTDIPFSQVCVIPAKAPASLGETLMPLCRESVSPGSMVPVHAGANKAVLQCPSAPVHTEMHNTVLTDSSASVLESVQAVVAPELAKDAGQRTASGLYPVHAPIEGTWEVVVVALAFYHEKNVRTGLTRLPSAGWQVKPRSYSV